MHAELLEFLFRGHERLLHLSALDENPNLSRSGSLGSRNRT